MGLIGALIGGAIVISEASAQDPSPAFELHGAVVVDGGVRLALIQEPRLVGGAAIFREGDTIGPFRVAEVRPDSVRIEGEGKTFLVMLRGPAIAPGEPPHAQEGVGEKAQRRHQRHEGQAEKGAASAAEPFAGRQGANRQRVEQVNRDALSTRSGPGNFRDLLQGSPLFQPSPQGGGG